MSDKVAYVATGEQAFLVCAFAKTTKSALKILAKKLDEVLNDDTILIGINVYLDDDGYQHLTATLSTTVL